MVEHSVQIGPLALDGGGRLERVVQAVTIYGEPRPDGSNVVLVNHALSGNSRVADWWGGIAGEGKLLDPARVAVVGINALGGCYGSTGPATPGSDGKPYGSRFPVVTVGDIVRAQAAALAALGIPRLAAVMGGSLGGMQALQWALDFPERVEHAIAIGAYDYFADLGIGLNMVACEAIRNDPHFNGGNYYEGPPPREGVRQARMIAMLSYKSDPLLAQRFGRRADRKGGDPWKNRWDRFDVEGYLQYQGDIFVGRMDANTYLTLTRAMDLFDTRGKLSSTRTRLTFVGIRTDWLFPAPYVRAAAQRFSAEGCDARYLEMQSDHGHDAFLAETGELAALLAPVLNVTHSTVPAP